MRIASNFFLDLIWFFEGFYKVVLSNKTQSYHLQHFRIISSVFIMSFKVRFAEYSKEFHFNFLFFLQPIDESKEDFRMQLAKHGVLDALTKVLAKIQDHQPENPLEVCLLQFRHFWWRHNDFLSSYSFCTPTWPGRWPSRTRSATWRKDSTTPCRKFLDCRRKLIVWSSCWTAARSATRRLTSSSRLKL